MLSPYARGEPNLIDPGQLARNLACVAVVVEINDPEITWDFADEVGRQLSYFNGAARIYWPEFSKDSGPRSHRLFLGAWIEQAGPAVASRTIERAVFAVAAFRFVPDQRISDLIRTVEAAQRHRHLSEKKAAGNDSGKITSVIWSGSMRLRRRYASSKLKTPISEPISRSSSPMR